MPVIHIEYDDAAIHDDQVELLSHAVRDIVAEETQIDDVFVYANTARIKVKVAPIEIFVAMSDHKISDIDDLVSRLRRRIHDWKVKVNFPYMINLTFTPMPWKIELGI